ncbi:MAG: CsbD family protein [Alphaproteobacteria bacterium]|nr:CsbD family protein [Alphaproteobacteria bacterium]
MNTDQMKGNWKQLIGKAKEKWGQLTDDDWRIVEGQRDQLVGRIQERYGIAREEAQRQVDEFDRSYDKI